MKIEELYLKELENLENGTTEKKAKAISDGIIKTLGAGTSS